MDGKMTIGDFIAYHRKKSGYRTQRLLADKTGISNATISRIEKSIQKPEINTLKVLSDVLPTTNLMELLDVAGYIDRSVFEERNRDEESIDLRNVERYSFCFEEEMVTTEEWAGMLSYLRAYRKMRKELENN